MDVNEGKMKKNVICEIWSSDRDEYKNDGRLGYGADR